MKRRIGVIALIALAGAGWGGTAASAGALRTSASEYWGCVVADDLDLGLCLKDPAPGPLPLPDPSLLPSVPSVQLPAPAPAPV